MAQPKEMRKGISAPAVVGVIAFALVAVVGIAAFISPTGIAPTCTINGFGTGTCTFTNEGFLPWKLCGRLIVTRDESGRATSSSVFCSGFVLPQSSVSVNFAVEGVQQVCAVEFPTGRNWKDVCSMSFKAWE